MEPHGLTGSSILKQARKTNHSEAERTTGAKHVSCVYRQAFRGDALPRDSQGPVMHANSKSRLPLEITTELGIPMPRGTAGAAGPLAASSLQYL
jgi:hypothetical protein